MRFFYDTEFIEDGTTIELVSIGIVAEDGQEYYAVSTDFHPNRASEWVKNNVLNQLPNPDSPQWKSLETIREEVGEFLQRNSQTELWAWIGCYDHVLLAQMWGAMPELPRHIPRFTHEIKQYWELAGKPPLPEVPDGNHNALVDARHNLEKFNACMKALPVDKKGRVVR